MVLHGRIENGAVVFPDGLSLPNGTEVTVIVERADEGRTSKTDAEGKLVKLPLVGSKSPASVALTADRIAEILNADDLSS